MNRTLFSKLVQEKMEMCLYLEDYARLALNEIKRKNFGLVQKTLSQMGRMWPHSEEYILLNIQYLALMHKGKEIQQFINEIYKRAKLFICQSKMVADYYTSVPDAIKRIIPNPVEPKNLPERRPPVPNRIVAVGRLSLQKNFAMLINSFNNVYKDFPGCKLDIYGEGEIRGQLEKQIDDLGLNDVVTLCGAKTNVQEHIADADLFVMSSDYEGFPNALLEAVAIGLPVISTAFPTGVAYELITDDNGIIVPVNDEGAMTDAIRNMLSDKDRLEAMGKNSHESAKKYYTENIIKMWEDALSNIL
jgi:glycosyltransferase involved in cell wall biosynthesis